MPRVGLILLFFAGEALAHPDHGSGGWLSATLSHLLSEPDHLVVIVAPLVIGLLLVGKRVAKLRALRRRAQFEE